MVSPVETLKWLRRGSRPPVVLCPNCRQEMLPKDRTPLLFTHRLVDITYLCERCGATARRTIKDTDAA